MIKASMKQALTKEQIELELKKHKYKEKYFKILKSTIYSLIIVIAVALIVATFIFPVLEISGNSMNPILKDKDIVVVFKGKKYETDDIIAFFYGNKILIKRVIGNEGDWINIDNEGNIYVNGKKLDKYSKNMEIDKGDITYPYQVPSNKYFVLSDNHEVILDSRNKMIGCVSEDDVIGKIIIKIWPIKEFDFIY